MIFTPMNDIDSLNGPVLITGHTGFKGTWLTLLLEYLGVPVLGYSLMPTQYSLYTQLERQNRIQEKFSDIRDIECLNKFISETNPKYVIHLAAQPLVLESYTQPLETFGVNVMGTVNLLNSCFKESSIEKVIIATTDKVYRNRNLGIEFVEDDPLEGSDPYSGSKVAAEAAVSSWQKIQSMYGGPKVVSVRAGNVIGGGDLSENRLLPDVIRAISSKGTLSIRNPNSTRPWQHALDPLWGYLSILQKYNKDVSPAYNFGPSEFSLTVNEVLEVCNSILNEKITVEAKDSKSESLTKSEIKKESEKLDLNSSLAKSELGWAPVWTQTESILRTINWWYSTNNLDLTPMEACMRDIKDFLDLKKKIKP
jgi:CDP-glucose 4,6-dehydratase